jgi:triacylglycerol lipase
MPGNNKSSSPSRSRGLVAPELLPFLDVLPAFDFNEQVLPTVRAGTAIDRKDRPSLSPEQQTVACEERCAPGPPGAPEVRVLVYTPPGQKTVMPRPAYLHMHGGAL